MMIQLSQLEFTFLMRQLLHLKNKLNGRSTSFVQLKRIRVIFLLSTILLTVNHTIKSFKAFCMLNKSYQQS